MLDKKLLYELQEYIDIHIKEDKTEYCESMIHLDKIQYEEVQKGQIKDFIKNKQKPKFNEILFNFIDERGRTDSEVYKKAGIDRRHFSKIRSNADYCIGKNSAIALALALELNKKETEELLGAAGYTLSDSDIFDLVIQFCIEKKIYNIDDVNEVLDYFGLKTL